MQLLVASMFGMIISGRDRSPFGNTAAGSGSASAFIRSFSLVQLATHPRGHDEVHAPGGRQSRGPSRDCSFFCLLLVIRYIVSAWQPASATGALGTALYFTSPSFVPPAAPHAATAAPENIQRCS